MNNFWLRIACFFTGYSYTIIRESSQASIIAVKKYFGAILIVSILWGFIGFAFSKRYIHTDLIGSSIVAVTMIFIVIQIERQIILSVGKNHWAKAFRIIIAIVMAIIGSVIIDQSLFKEDVEKRKIRDIQEEVNIILPTKTTQLDSEITALQSEIEKKEKERLNFLDEVSKKPNISGYRTERMYIKVQKRDITGALIDTIEVRTNVIRSDVPNPKLNLLPLSDQQISELRFQSSEKQKYRLTMRDTLESQLKSKTGFLDELTTLMNILVTHKVAFFVWICLFIFFLSIELFVLVNKFGESINDYDKTLIHQMETRLNILESLSNNNGTKTTIKQ